RPESPGGGRSGWESSFGRVLIDLAKWYDWGRGKSIRSRKGLRLAVDEVIGNDEIAVAAIADILKPGIDRGLTGGDHHLRHDRSVEHDSDERQARRIAPSRRQILAQAPALCIEQLDGGRPLAVHIGEDDSDSGDRGWRGGPRHREEQVHRGTPDGRERLGLAERLELSTVRRVQVREIIVASTESGAGAAKVGPAVIEEERRKRVDVG